MCPGNSGAYFLNCGWTPLSRCTSKVVTERFKEPRRGGVCTDPPGVKLAWSLRTSQRPDKEGCVVDGIASNVAISPELDGCPSLKAAEGKQRLLCRMAAPAHEAAGAGAYPLGSRHDCGSVEKAGAATGRASPRPSAGPASPRPPLGTRHGRLAPRNEGPARACGARARQRAPHHPGGAPDSAGGEAANGAGACPSESFPRPVFAAGLDRRLQGAAWWRPLHHRVRLHGPLGREARLVAVGACTSMDLAPLDGPPILPAAGPGARARDQRGRPIGLGSARRPAPGPEIAETWGSNTRAATASIRAWPRWGCACSGAFHGRGGTCWAPSGGSHFTINSPIPNACAAVCCQKGQRRAKTILSKLC
jgi:hypothetical protein